MPPNERFWVKFHFKTMQGHKHWTNAEAARGRRRRRASSTQEDLFGAIEKGDFPRWKVQVQIMPERDADKTPYNPFDLTKVWPHDDYPLIDVGVLELNRNPDNYFAEIEQAAFAPSNIVPGIGFSPDKMLQARIFSYADAHRYRLGTHYEALPVNAPRCPVHHYHKDGPMRFFRNDTGNPDAYYEPNSFNGPAQIGRLCASRRSRSAGDADRYNHRDRQRRLQPAARAVPAVRRGPEQRLFDNIAAAMGRARGDRRAPGRPLREVHPDYGAGVAPP